VRGWLSAVRAAVESTHRVFWAFVGAGLTPGNALGKCPHRRQEPRSAPWAGTPQAMGRSLGTASRLSPRVGGAATGAGIGKASTAEMRVGQDLIRCG
jgi:hypothetical protein